MNSLPAVQAYFAADKAGNVDTLTELFLADAAVIDEGGVHNGLGAIRTWWQAAKEKYHYVAEPIEMTVTGGKVAVRAKVSGQFPNSPVTLDYLFTLDMGKIVQLEIR